MLLDKRWALLVTLTWALISCYQGSMGNLSALLFIGLSYLVIFWSPVIRGQRELLYACYFGLTFRHALAFINAFVAPLSTRWGDLYGFHNFALGLIKHNTHFYGHLLKAIYRIFGASFWLGEVVSVLVFALGLILFVNLGQRLGLQKHLVPAVLIFGLMPSPAIHSSVTLRESYQVFGFLGSVYGLILLRENPRPWAWLLLLGSCFLTVLMHQSLAVLALAILGFGLPWAMRGGGQFGPLVSVLMLALLPAVLPVAMEHLKEESHTVRAITEGRLVEYASTYREHVEEARTDYGVSIETDNLLTGVSSTVVVVAMYFFAPMPWQIQTGSDVYAFFEVAVRFLLLLGIARNLKASQGEHRARMIAVLALALALECMWAVGTSNWGTAVRHHVVAFWALALLGAPRWEGFSLDPDLSALLARRQQRKALEIRP